MTPLDLLHEATRRFMVLYHNDPQDLRRLMRQALGKFQDKAGWIAVMQFEQDAILPPSGFHSVASICDSQRRYVPFHRDEDGSIVLDPLDKDSCPYFLHYFVDLRHWPDNEDLPGDVPSLLTDYLEALIAVQNTQRERNVMYLTGQGNYQDLPQVSELRARILELEQMMEDNKSLIVPASYF